MVSKDLLDKTSDGNAEEHTGRALILFCKELRYGDKASDIVERKSVNLLRTNGSYVDTVYAGMVERVVALNFGKLDMTSSNRCHCSAASVIDVQRGLSSGLPGAFLVSALPSWLSPLRPCPSCVRAPES